MNKKKLYRDKEWLYKHYVILNYPMQQLATSANCGIFTIHRWLHLHDIPIRKGGIPKGTKLSPLWRKNISQGLMGKTLSKKRREKLSISHMGIIHSGSFKKGHKTNIGRFCPEETKKKIRQAHLARWDRWWIEGLTSEERKHLRTCNAYKSWQQAVYKKDGYICQICHSIGKQLNAHHLKSFSGNPDKRFDVNNGITLCKICHLKIHQKQLGI